MKLKKFSKFLPILILLLAIISVTCYKYYSPHKVDMIGIYKENLFDPKTEFLGNYNKDKLNPKFAGYILGKDLNNVNNLIRKDFKTKTLLIFGIELKIPDFMQYFSPVEINTAIDLVPTKNDINNEFSKNSLTITIINTDKDNTYINTPEKYIKNEQKMFGTYDPSVACQINSYKIDKDLLTIDFNGNYSNTEDNSSNKKFKVYEYIKFKNNKIYKISYRYQDIDIGNKVINLINSSFKFKNI